MTLGDKWQRVTKNTEYDKDNTIGMDFQESPLKKVLIGSAIAAGGVLAYKNGMLKGGVKKMYEYSAKYRAYTPSVAGAFNSWAKKDVDVSINSIFKNKDLRYKDLFKSKEYTKMVYKDTVTDLKDLKRGMSQGFKDARTEGKDITKRIYNGKGTKSSKLMFELNHIESVTDQIKGANSAAGRKVASNLMHENLVERMTLTVKEAEKQARRTGYKSATLDDLVHVVKDDKAEHGFMAISKHRDIEVDETTIKRIEKFMATPVKDEKGIEHTLFSSGKYKDIVLDHNIVVEADGKKALDMRNANHSLKSFTQALAKDFQIPVIGINPLRMFGLDTIADTEKSFAIFHKNTIQPAITKQAGRVHLKDVEELGSHAILGVGDSLYKFNDDMSSLEKIASNKKFHLVNGEERLSREVHDYRKMANLNTKDFIDHAEPGDTIKSNINYYVNKGARKLDIGFQDHRLDDVKYMAKDKGNILKGVDTDSIFKWLNPDTYTSLGAEKMAKIFKPYKEISEDTRNLKTLFGTVEQGEDLYVATNKTFRFKDAFNKESSTEVKDVFQQLIAGRKGNVMSDHITGATTIPYFGLGRINDTLAGLGLGLSNESMGSTFDIGKNLIMKRALPVYMGYQAFQYANYLTEGKDKDETGNSSNIQKTLAKGVVKLDMGWHQVKDTLGITKVAKELADLTPGSEQIGDIPGLGMLNLASTAEERDKYWREGEVAVRKGRYWSLGNTAFTGGKVMYYQPNWYRRVQADVDYSDVRYGSRKEYFDNAAFPTPLAPLAPIRHFITDRYHYENKHYNDRPYLISSPAMENLPLVGPLLSGTIGQILKPSINMHPEYWKEGRSIQVAENAPTKEFNISTDDDTENILATGAYRAFDVAFDAVQKVVPFDMSVKEKDYKIPVPKGFPIGKSIIGRISSPSSSTIQSSAGASASTVAIDETKDISDEALGNTTAQVTTPSTTIINNGVAEGGKRIIFPTANPENDKADKAFEDINLYETSSGNMQVVGTGPDNLSKVNKQLKDYSLKKIIGTDSRASVTPDVVGINDSGARAENPYSATNMLQSQLGNTNNVLGMYGFINSGFVVGHPGAGKQIIETSGYMSSFNKTFWDQELGGLGENFSEIFRRFVPKRRNDVDYFNPVKNDMASWMPGQDYFTDFQHGDPYIKIGRGEMRLPGQGYERLRGLKDPTKLEIGTRTLGKTKSELEKHFLHQDTVIDEDGKKEEAASKKLRSSVMSNWMKSGLAIDTKGKIDDAKHEISGQYDAIIHDATTTNGKAVASIETVSAKEFKEIKSSGDIQDAHKKQLNYLMWATGNEKGYVHYVNQEDSSKQVTIGADFSKGLFNDTMRNLKNARNDIRDKMSKGEIGKGELYSQLDRFRILADTAPYSKEFQEQNAIISRMKLSTEEQENVSEIRDRMKEAKEPMRIYEYKFKTADVKYEDVTVTKVLNNNTFMVAERPDNPIRLAGIHVSEDKASENRKEIDKTVKKYIHEGKKIKIAVDADSANEVSNDSLKTVHAVVYNGGMNVNQMLMKRGYAKEKEKDWSATGVRARFSSGKIAFGKAWESMAHFDSFANTKFLQVRSAKENYERREVYGKDFQRWENPIKDFITPSVQSNIHRPLGIILGALTGAAFGKTGSARFVGAVVGGGTVAIGKMFTGTRSAVTGKPWIPKQRQKQRDLTEYVDMLKFVKNKRLYEDYADKALREDRIDVRKMVAEEKASGKDRKARIEVLNELKRTMKVNQKILSDKEQNKIITKPLKYDDVVAGPIDKTNKLGGILKDAVEDVVDKKRPKGKITAARKGITKAYKYVTDKIIDDGDEKFNARLRSINKEIGELQGFREAYKTSNNATKAIFYKQKAEETMYGYDPGDPLTNVLKAMPKKDREYMKYFLKAPEKEREGILKMVPNYMKRPLQSAWGMPVDQKEDAVQYFTKHQLPGQEWAGWREDKDLDSVKVKMVKHEAQDFSEFNIWQNDVDKANQMGEMPLPRVDFRASADTVRHKMLDMLGDMGMRDIRISYSFIGNDASVNMNVHEDKRNETERKLKHMTIR